MSRIESGFHTGVIDSPEKLYGWNEKGNLLDRIFNRVLNGSSFLLYGERKSGKTSLINCLIHRLKQNDVKLLPVLVSFQMLVNFKNCGSARGYYYIAQKIFDCLQATHVILSTNSDLSIKPPVENASDSNIEFFDSAVSWLEKNKRSMVLIFDDYEHLAQVFHDKKNDFFYPFRSLQDRYNKETGGIFCILAGTETTERYSSMTGSPQFNLITDRINIPPLNLDSFRTLWNQCRKASCSQAQANLDVQEVEIKNIYELCGGKASFAKFLGNQWAIDGIFAKSNPLEECFKNIFDRHHSTAQNILIKIAHDKPIKENASILKHLVELGLIKKNDDEIGGYSIQGILWKKFLENMPELSEANVLIDFQHAGELAAKIVKENKLDALLKIQKKHGELDWLEYKSVLMPSAEQMKIDNEGLKSSLTKDDYIWHVAKAIIAMRNSRGGLVIIGINDSGEVLGVHRKPNENDEAFLRKDILGRLRKATFKIHGDTTIDLSKCDWDIDAHWIYIDVSSYDNKSIVTIIVQPDFDSPPRLVVEKFIRPREMEYKYMLIRANKGAKNKEIKDDEIQKHFNDMKKHNNNDLKDYWKKLV